MNLLMLENIKLALISVKSHLLRTVLTVLIIAIGITALVGILTAIDVMKSTLTSSFADMGSNTFSIRDLGSGIHIGSQHGRKRKAVKRISYEEAMKFAKEFNFPSMPSVSTEATSNGTVKFESKKTNPNIEVYGADEKYIQAAALTLTKGRNFSSQEIQNGSSVVIIGSDLVKTLFEGRDPIDQVISVGTDKYKVIGVLKERGSSLGFGGDKLVILPLLNVKQSFGLGDLTYTITVMVNNIQSIDVAAGEATGFFRTVRQVPLGYADDFEVSKSDSLATSLLDSLSLVTVAAVVIAIITLFGAAIGLMNIMMVSVTERTKEIGIRKAIGATSIAIRNQFLSEAIVICQLGGLLGAIMGVAIGNGMALYMHVGFILPWAWILLAIFVCLVVGVVSGLFPAVKAARLDPIEALRFE